MDDKTSWVNQGFLSWKNVGYAGCDFIECLSPTDDAQYSLEPALIAANGTSIDSLDKLAKIMLSVQTYNHYTAYSDLAAKRAFFEQWYEGNAGGRKVDSAIRIFDSAETIVFPDYLTKAVTFDT
jgi:putative ATP-dependent endonuclease of the OLD family